LMDCDGDGVLSVHEFIEGLLRMQSGNASAKHVMSLQYDLQHMWNLLGQGQDALAEGQLFIRNDLRSGQRQLARRIEAKLDKMLGGSNLVRTGSGGEEAETPSAAAAPAVLQRQSYRNLIGWQWANREKATEDHAPPVSNEALPLTVPQCHVTDKAVGELVEKLSSAVRDSLFEATEQLERRMQAWLEAEQRPWVRKEDKTLPDLMAAVESLPSRLQEELVPALRGAAASSSPETNNPPEHMSHTTSESILKLEGGSGGATGPGANRQPHYSQEALRPPALDPAGFASHTSNSRAARPFFTEALAEASCAMSNCGDASPKTSPTSNAATDARPSLSVRAAGIGERFEIVKENSEKSHALPVLLDPVAAAQRGRNAQRRLSSTTAMSEIAEATANIAVARSVSPCTGVRSELLGQQHLPSVPVRPVQPGLMSFPRGTDSMILDPRPEAWATSTGMEGMLWAPDPLAGGPWHPAMQLQPGVSLLGHTPCRRDLWPRLLNMKRWAVERGLANMPFDKLVLHLDSLGIQLSIPEQDALKQLMQGPPTDGLGLQMPYA